MMDSYVSKIHHFCTTKWKHATFIVLTSMILTVWLYSRDGHHLNDYGRKSIIFEGDKTRQTFDYYVIRRLDYLNYARISAASDPETRDIIWQRKDHGLFHIVTTFVPFDHEDVRSNLMINGHREPTDKELQARMAEVTECLQKNLNHRLVAFVHALVLREDTISYLRMLDLSNSQKLIIHRAIETPTMKHEIMYASKYLEKKMVIITHQDNYLGDGWQKIDHKYLKKNKLMYALTRHLPPSNCPAATTAAHCGESYPYVGSHDTFVFHVHKAIPDHQLVEIDVAPNMSGIENVLMWIFRKRLGYRIINPCRILIVYHNHCVPIREAGRERINIEKSALAYFTNQLT